MTKDNLQAAVDEETPESRWFTPASGWVAASTGRPFAGGKPPQLMPTATEAPELFMPPDEALGELRVELLEADALPDKDLNLTTRDFNDVYAMVIFEDSIARTPTLYDNAEPKWHSECARAFRFPIRAPHSSLHVALFDSDERELVNLVDTGLTGFVDGVDYNTEKMMSAIDRTAGVDSALPDSDESAAAAMRARRRSMANRETMRQLAHTYQQTAAIKPDDAIGRITLDLRDLHSDVLYDSWCELQPRP